MLFFAEGALPVGGRAVRLEEEADEEEKQPEYRISDGRLIEQDLSKGSSL